MGKSIRRHDLDWLRVLAVLLLVPFHSALIFSLRPGDIVYVKDQVESEILIQLAYFVHQWHMPLLFMIAGASTWFALEKRTGGQYLAERVKRLLVPTLFGITVLVPPMVYMQFLDEPRFGSFWQFYPRFFQIDFEDLSGNAGTFTPAHFWFVIFLFVFSAAALPLFLALKRAPGRRLVARLATFLQKPGMIFLPALPLALAVVLLDIGGKAPLLHLTLFVYGFVLAADERFQDAMDRHVVSALVVGVIATACLYILANRVLLHLVYYLSRWCWLVVIFGLGRRYLNASGRLLRYASEAAYPFYMLHFLINTAVGYVVTRWDTGVALKYLAINALTIPMVVLVYELVVKRTGITRFLFGMKTCSRGEPRPRAVART